LGVAGEQRRGGAGLAQQLDDRPGQVAAALADLRPGVVQVHAHPAHAGGGQQEAGEGVAIAWRGGHGGNTDNDGGMTLTGGDRGAMTQAHGRRIFSRPRKRWGRLLWLVPLLCVAFTVLQVAVLRFVDPPFSAFMAARQFEAWGEGDWSYRIAYDWRDLDAMAPHVPLALVA